MESSPPSLPAGLVIEHSTARLRPGMADEAEHWMAYLNDVHEQCVASLARDGVVAELVFRSDDEQGQWLHWVTVRSATGVEHAEQVPVDERTDLDRTHLELSRRCKEPGWREARLVNVLLAPPVEASMLDWVGITAGGAVVRRLWDAMQGRRWDEARSLLDDRFRCWWPETGERFEADGFVAMNRAYPTAWAIEVVEVLPAGERVVSRVRVRDESGVHHASSFFTVRDGLATELVEHWTREGAAAPPPWRAQFCSPG